MKTNQKKNRLNWSDNLLEYVMNLPTAYTTECGTQATSDDGYTWILRDENQTEEEWLKLVAESEYKLNPYKKI